MKTASLLAHESMTKRRIKVVASSIASAFAMILVSGCGNSGDTAVSPAVAVSGDSASLAAVLKAFENDPGLRMNLQELAQMIRGGLREDALKTAKKLAANSKLKADQKVALENLLAELAAGNLGK